VAKKVQARPALLDEALAFGGPIVVFDKVDLAFDSWAWPLLGLIFLPWTTLCYVIAWSAVGGVDGAGWLLVSLGVALDIASYSARSAKARYGSAY